MIAFVDTNQKYSIKTQTPSQTKQTEEEEGELTARMRGTCASQVPLPMPQVHWHSCGFINKIVVNVVAVG